MKNNLNTNHFFIKQNFIISIYEESFKIKKDKNPLNTKTYLFKDIVLLEIEDEFNPLGNLFLKFLFGFSRKDNTEVLSIETIKETNKIYLIDCDMETLTQAVFKINQIIVNTNSN